MCGILLTWWFSRNNNGPIVGSKNQIRGSAINTRIVKLPVEEPSRPKSEDKKAVNEEGTETSGLPLVAENCEYISRNES